LNLFFLIEINGIVSCYYSTISSYNADDLARLCVSRL